MRVEGSASETDVGWTIIAESPHPRPATAHHPDGKAASERLAVGDQVRADGEVILRAAGREAEPHEHVVDDQRDIAPRADVSDLPQPRSIGLLVVARGAI